MKGINKFNEGTMAESLKPRWQALSNTIFQKLSSLSLVFWRHEALGTECYHGACDLPQFFLLFSFTW